MFGLSTGGRLARWRLIVPRRTGSGSTVFLHFRWYNERSSLDRGRAIAALGLDRFIAAITHSAGAICALDPIRPAGGRSGEAWAASRHDSGPEPMQAGQVMQAFEF